MRLTPGTHVGPYQVMAPLGAGGMAEVYRARDSRLHRDVALKVVGEVFGDDSSLLARLEQEARLAGSLNHPNIVAVHDVGSHQGAPYVVTELLEGETLRQRLTRGRVPLSSALGWAVQMAQGLDAAHAHGVVHRDLKPENVFLTHSGNVKLLDFGIAKASIPSSRHDLTDPTLSPSGSLTGTGAVLGTPGYMSPEQVQGLPVDARSDIFSLGAVLYELLAGHRAFRGGSVIESGHAILHDDPAPLPDSVPASVAQIVRRCLEKEPARRFQSARDVGFALEAVGGRSDAVTPAGVPRLAPRPPRRALLALAVAAVAAVGWGAWVLASRLERTGPPAVRQLTFRRGSILSARFAPDGRTVHYTAAWNGGGPRIYSTTVDSPEARPLDIGDAQLLAVSASGELAVTLHPKMILFDGSRGTLALIPAMGGTPRELATDVEYADWAPDGQRLAVARWEEGKSRLEFPVGNVLFQSPGWISHPRVSPSGDRIAFIEHERLGAAGQVRVITPGGSVEDWGPRFSPVLGLAWTRGGSELIVAAAFHDSDLESLWNLRRGRQPRLLYRGSNDLILADAAPDGRLLVIEADWRQEVELVAHGEPRRTLEWGDWARLVGLSDDGKLAVTVEDGRATDGTELSFLWDRRHSLPARLGGAGQARALSPDGKWILMEDPRGHGSIFLLPNGPGQARPLVESWLTRIDGAVFFPDGRRVVLLGRTREEEPRHLWLLDTESKQKQLLSPQPVGGDGGQLAVSRDQRWVAFEGVDGAVNLLGLDRGPPLPVGDWAGSRRVAGWLEDGSLLVYEPLALPSRVERFDPRSRQLTPFASLMPSDAAGVTRVIRVRVTPDGQTVAFGYRRESALLTVLDWSAAR
jgi:eukaryotic-like serine/threonine-protein kinase